MYIIKNGVYHLWFSINLNLILNKLVKVSDYFNLTMISTKRNVLNKLTVGPWMAGRKWAVYKMLWKIVLLP